MSEGTRVICAWALSCQNGDPETRTCMLKVLTLNDTGNTDLRVPDSLRCQDFKWLANVKEIIRGER